VTARRPVDTAAVPAPTPRTPRARVTTAPASVARPIVVSTSAAQTTLFRDSRALDDRINDDGRTASAEATAAASRPLHRAPFAPLRARARAPSSTYLSPIISARPCALAALSQRSSARVVVVVVDRASLDDRTSFVPSITVAGDGSAATSTADDDAQHDDHMMRCGAQCRHKTPPRRRMPGKRARGEDDARGRRWPEALVVTHDGARDGGAAACHACAEHGDAEDLAAWLFAPLDAEAFARECVDRQVVHFKRTNARARFDGWFGLADVEALARLGTCAYGTDVDVTSYVNGVRRTHNHNDRAMDGDGDCGRVGAGASGGGGGGEEARDVIIDADALMRRFREDKCSLRVLHPQTRHDGMWKILATLETFFGCATGCNVYCTPPNSQGFAPHYDDIDAFVCQIEGEKRWRVYEPLEDEQYPRVSSKNFTQEEIMHQRVLFDGVLSAGDVLYMPRGAIHQAECSRGDELSVHATISTNQLNAPADLLEMSVGDMLQDFINTEKECRKSLPRTFLRDQWAQDGTEAGDAVKRVVEFQREFLRRMTNGDEYIKEARNRLGARLMLQRLPPPPSHFAKSPSYTGPDAARKMLEKAPPRVTLQLSGAQRVCVFDDRLAVCHIFDNARDASHRLITTHDVATASSSTAKSIDDENVPGYAYFDARDGQFLDLLLDTAEDAFIDVQDLATEYMNDKSDDGSDDDAPVDDRDVGHFVRVAARLVARRVLALERA